MPVMSLLTCVAVVVCPTTSLLSSLMFLDGLAPSVVLLLYNRSGSCAMSFLSWLSCPLRPALAIVLTVMIWLLFLFFFPVFSILPWPLFSVCPVLAALHWIA